MKLYYDMLIPYMPDSVQNDNGELIQDSAKAAGRRAMMELANFQNSGNLMSLYQSVIFACTYAGMDLVDTISASSDSDNLVFPMGTSVEELINNAALILFKSIKPDYEFDCSQFVANILTASHIIMNSQVKEENEEDTKSE